MAVIRKNESLRRALVDGQRNADAARGKIYPNNEVDEIAHMRRLGNRLFGNRGMLEVDPKEPGKIWLGVWEREPKFNSDGTPAEPLQNIRRKLLCSGRTYAELLAQARLLPVNMSGPRAPRKFFHG